MIVKKAHRKLVFMLIGLLLVIILSVFNVFDFDVLPLSAFIIGLILVIYLFYVYNLVTDAFYSGLYKNYAKKIYTIIDYLSVFISVVLVVQIVFNFLFFPATVRMSSMNPLLFENDRILVFNENNNLDRFNVVVFEVDTDIQTQLNESENGSLWVKRVIGLPGEKIDFQNGKLYVNNVELYEPFLYDDNGFFHLDGIRGYYSLTPNFQMQDILEISGLEGNVIPKDYYLLLGDNRAYSTDANEIGLVHKSQIVGEGKYIIKGIFSFEKIGE